MWSLKLQVGVRIPRPKKRLRWRFLVSGCNLRFHFLKSGMNTLPYNRIPSDNCGQFLVGSARALSWSSAKLHDLRTSSRFDEWSCKMSLPVIQNHPYVSGEIRIPGYITIRVTYASLLLPGSERGVPVSVNSPRHCSTVYAQFFRCDVTDVLQTALAIILAINVNFTSVILRRHVRQGEVLCSFRSFRRRTVSMYNRRWHDDLFGHQVANFSTFFALDFYTVVSSLVKDFCPTSRGCFSTDNNCRHAPSTMLPCRQWQANPFWYNFLFYFCFYCYQLIVLAFGWCFGAFLEPTR